MSQEKPPIEKTYTLHPSVVEQLDELAYLAGVPPERVIATLVGNAYRERSKQSAAACPWEITLGAKQDYLAIANRRETPDTLDEATDVLEMAAIDADRAEAAGQRMPVRLDSGALRYRGPKPRRLTLIVKKDEWKKVLVAVQIPRGGK